MAYRHRSNERQRRLAAVVAATLPVTSLQVVSSVTAAADVADPWPVVARIGDPAAMAFGGILDSTGTHIAYLQRWANGRTEVLLTDLLTGDTEVVATRDDFYTSHIDQLDISAGGNEVTMHTGYHHLWLWSRGTPGLERLDVDSNGTPVNSGYDPTISDDGTLVAFSSRADIDGTELPQLDWDCFLRDRTTGTTTRLWTPPGGDVVGNPETCARPLLSTDGSTAVVAAQLPGTPSSRKTPVAIDVATLAAAPMAVRPDGELSTEVHNENAFAVSADGRYVAFAADSGEELIGGTTVPSAPNSRGIYLRDRDTDADGTFDEAEASSTTLVADLGTAWNTKIAIAGDGSSLAWSSYESEVKIWHRTSGRVESFTTPGPARALSFSGTGAVLSYVADDCRSVCDTGLYVAFPRHDGSGARLLPARQVLPVGATANIQLHLGTFGAEDNVPVLFNTVSGPNATAPAPGSCRTGRTNMPGGSCATDRNGIAMYTYRGSGGTGEDVVRATIDANRNGVADPDEATYSATILWRDELRYGSLGDSFTSGEGVRPYMPGTDDEANRCHRSFYAYPELVRYPGAPPVSTNPELTTISHLVRQGDAQALPSACSGAVIENITETGQHNELPQVDMLAGLTEPPNFVTAGIGGNDARFSEILDTCARHACTAASFEFRNGLNLVDWIDDFVGEVLPARLDDLLVSVKDAADPDASIMLIGYPQLFPQSSAEQGCAKLTPWSGEMDALRKGTSDLNDAIEAAAARHGVHFISLEEAYAGHEVCGDDGEYINGLVLLSPLSSFHPKAVGHGLAGRVISDHIHQWIEDDLPLNGAAFPQTRIFQPGEGWSVGLTRQVPLLSGTIRSATHESGQPEEHLTGERYRDVVRCR